MAKYEKQKIFLEVKRGVSGLGLFVKKDICQGTFIAEYSGEIISEEEANRRGGKYLFQINSKWVIDGKDRENIARYINHSCRPNCEVKVFRKQIFIYALKDIQTGEELGFDYGKYYFESYIKPKGCQCMHCRVKRYLREA